MCRTTNPTAPAISIHPAATVRNTHLARMTTGSRVGCRPRLLAVPFFPLRPPVLPERPVAPPPAPRPPRGPADRDVPLPDLAEFADLPLLAVLPVLAVLAERPALVPVARPPPEPLFLAGRAPSGGRLWTITSGGSSL